MKIQYAERLKKLPPYLFAEIEEKLVEMRKRGVDLIPLGIGDPDIPTPGFIIDELVKQAKDPKNHNYPTSMGELDYRQAVARWYRRRFNVLLEPDKNVMNLIGAKEGVANLVRAYANPGDTVLVPDPGYPVYANGGTTLCDAEAYKMPLLEENNFLPDFSQIPPQVAKKAKLMFLNYPNNPTAAVADKDFLKTAIDYAEENNILICYDNAYCEFTFGDYRAPSILELDGGMQHIELQSLSKTFCMTGDRVGYAAGGEEAVAGLKKVKSQIDSGCPMYIQRAAIKALDTYTSSERPKEVEENMREYMRRRDVLVEGLNKIGIPCAKPDATFYLWVNVEGSCIEFAKKVLETGVVVTPGVGFGEHGEGYVRFALTQPRERLQEAVERISKVL